jgi:hypothetical protein
VALHKIAQDHVGPEWPRTDQVGPDPANVVEDLSAPKLIGGTPSLCRSTTQLVVRPSSVVGARTLPAFHAFHSIGTSSGSKNHCPYRGVR